MTLILLLLLISCSGPAELVIDAEYNDPAVILTPNLPIDEEVLVGRLALEPNVPVTVTGDADTLIILPRDSWPEESRITLSIEPFNAGDAVLDSSFTFIFQTPPAPTFELTAVGDVMLDYLTSKRLRNYDPSYPFAAIAPILQQGDLIFANLECPISDRGLPLPKTYAFCASTFTINALAASGINAVSLANNHILDYGSGAFEDTLEILEKHGIAYAGAGWDEATARHGALFEINGISTALLAYSAVFNHGYPAWRAGEEKPGALYYRERAQFIDDIKNASRRADVVIVSLHFGEEYTYRINAEQRETARLAVESGADLVLGHHSHTPQGIEVYRGKPIVYSLGNFLFYPFSKGICNETYILRASLGKKGVQSIHLLPVLLGDSRPYLATGEEGARMRALLTGLLDELGTAWEIDGDVVTVLIP